MMSWDSGRGISIVNEKKERKRMDLLKKKRLVLDEGFSRITNLGEENDNILDKLCVLCLVLTPILQHYKGFVVEMSVCVLVVLAPYLGIKFLKRAKSIRVTDYIIILPLLLYKVYSMVAHGTNFIEIAYTLVICFYFVIAASGVLNIKYFIRYGYYVAMAASICIILQYCCFYIFDFHLQLVATSLLLPESDIWIAGAKTGVVGINGAVSSFYRPSAFFLEPSHMFLYLFPQMFVVLLSPKKETWKLVSGIIITLGIVLSTSGMGICVAFGAWGLYLACTNGKENITNVKYIFRKRNFIVIPVYLLICCLIFTTVPFVEYSITRIFTGENSVEQGDLGLDSTDFDESTDKSSTAIEGRTQVAASIIAKLDDKELVFGVSDTTAGLNCNMSGYMATLYKYGYIGIVLSYLFYVASFLKLRYHNVWIAFIILLVSYFSAHTHGTFYMLYYVLILLGGWHSAKNPYSLKYLGQLIKEKIKK